MTDTSTQSIVINASPDQVAAVICDFTRYPEWVSATKSVEVLEEYEDGYASQVRFVLDAGMIQDEDVGGLAQGDSRSIGGPDPFSGEVGALRVLRDGDVAAHSDGADSTVLHDDH